jgi:hypothetical protein
MNPLFVPKRPAWFWGSMVCIAIVWLTYAVWATFVPWRPGRPGGLVFGTIAALLFVYDAAYPVRRRLLAWPLRTAQQWLQLHIYGGVIALTCVIVHAGFAWPNGAMGKWLLWLSVWTVATGLLGVFLQKWIPRVIRTGLQVEALAARIPELTAQLAGEADRLISGGAPALISAYQAQIRPALQRPAPAWAYVVDVQAGRTRLSSALDALERVSGDRERLHDLRAIAIQKTELDVHLSLQRALRAWLWLHVPAAIVLIGLMAVHIFAALYL